jgi:hypothetical protein
MNLPNYDRWKLASPPHYDGPFVCTDCEEEIDEADVKNLGWRQLCPECFKKRRPNED